VKSPLIVKTVRRDTTYTHCVLWECSKRQIKIAEATPSGAQYFWIAAMLFGYMAFEAWLNYLGQQLAPQVWENERDFFRSNRDYKGTIGKLNYILDQYKIERPHRGHRPYCSIGALAKIRDEIAHGRPTTTSSTKRHPADTIPPFAENWLSSFANEKKATQYLADLKSYCDITVQLLRKTNGKKHIPFADIAGMTSLGLFTTRAE
jgi:hypothetical protein